MVFGRLVASAKEFIFSNKGLIIGSALFFLFQYYVPAPLPIKRSDYIAPPAIIQNLASGLQIQMADSFWLRALQDFDYCDHPATAKECRGESWLYQVLNLTVDLDKKFRDAYYYGALALTVIISDFQGASEIFDKGVEQFPTDWKLSYAAGYHAYYEEKNLAKAAKLYNIAAENGAPAWVKPLAGRIAADSGDNKMAAQILEEMIKNSEDPKLIERLKKKLSEVKE
ncbi:MAG: hypothetical protein H7061_00785 [Bdellovibrionaceae bacterium]|nr:hypothetical protein [Bdellovibrio sp.]